MRGERDSRRRRAEPRVEPEITDLWWVIRQQRRYWHIRRTCRPLVEAGMEGAGAGPRFIRPSGRWLSVRHRSPSGDLDADEADRRAVRGTESLFGPYRPEAPQAPDALSNGSLRSQGSRCGPAYFVVARRRETCRLASPQHGGARSGPVIAGSGLIHSLLTASSDRFA